MLMSRGASLPKHTHTHSIHAGIGNPQIRHTCLLVLTLAGVQNHIQTFITMQLVCCSGTTSAVRAVLSSPPSVRAPFPDFPFLLPSPLFLFIPLTLQKPPQTRTLPLLCLILFLPPPLSPFLPLEAGDVEGCSAVSDYQALLCERNDNHCAALQREKEEREQGRDGEGGKGA